MLTRRTFLANAACTLAAASCRVRPQSSARVSLEIPQGTIGPRIPADFLGLSYEVQQLADPAFFSAQNSGLISEFKALSTTGVLRLGGNTSEFAFWEPSPDSPEPVHPSIPAVVGRPKPRFYPVGPEAVRNLAAFLEATGWTCVYGIGMGTNTPARAAEEAAFVAAALGDRLQYFQVGNEPDLFGRQLRNPKTWSAKTYLQEWLSLARSISARVPEASFGLPDVADASPWLAEIADQWTTIQPPPHVTAVTHHYYVGGPATNPGVSIPNLLKPATMHKVRKMANTAWAAAGRIGTRLRMTEGNTCFGGGKPGVSDVFAAALWSADYSLLLASNFYAGINLQAGSGNALANAIGGSYPGDQLLRDAGATPAQIAAHPHPFYTPIARFGSDYVLEPVAYGLKFADAFSGGILLETEFSSRLQAAGVDATAYAARLPDGRTSVIILNKDALCDLEVELDFGRGISGEMELEALHGAALSSREANIIRLAKTESLKYGQCSVIVPGATGLRMTLSRAA